MAPPAPEGTPENPQNRRTSRRPPRYSPGATAAAAAAVAEAAAAGHQDNAVSPPTSSSRTTRSKSIASTTRVDAADDVVARLKRDFAKLATVTIPESEFSLPDDLLKPKVSSQQRRKQQPKDQLLKMPPVKRGKSKAPETPKTAEKEEEAQQKPEKGRGRARKSFSTPKLPDEEKEEQVVYSPAAKRNRTVPAKYRKSESPEPSKRTRQPAQAEGTPGTKGKKNGKQTFQPSQGTQGQSSTPTAQKSVLKKSSTSPPLGTTPVTVEGQRLTRGLAKASNSPPEALLELPAPRRARKRPLPSNSPSLPGPSKTENGSSMFLTDLDDTTKARLGTEPTKGRAKSQAPSTGKSRKLDEGTENEEPTVSKPEESSDEGNSGPKSTTRRQSRLSNVAAERTNSAERSKRAKSVVPAVEAETTTRRRPRLASVAPENSEAVPKDDSDLFKVPILNTRRKSRKSVVDSSQNAEIKEPPRKRAKGSSDATVTPGSRMTRAKSVCPAVQSEDKTEAKMDVKHVDTPRPIARRGSRRTNAESTVSRPSTRAASVFPDIDPVKTAGKKSLKQSEDVEGSESPNENVFKAPKATARRKTRLSSVAPERSASVVAESEPQVANRRKSKLPSFASTSPTVDSQNPGSSVSPGAQLDDKETTRTKTGPTSVAAGKTIREKSLVPSRRSSRLSSTQAAPEKPTGDSFGQPEKPDTVALKSPKGNPKRKSRTSKGGTTNNPEPAPTDSEFEGAAENMTSEGLETKLDPNGTEDANSPIMGENTADDSIPTIEPEAGKPNISDDQRAEDSEVKNGPENQAEMLMGTVQNSDTTDEATVPKMMKDSSSDPNPADPIISMDPEPIISPITDPVSCTTVTVTSETNDSINTPLKSDQNLTEQTNGAQDALTVSDKLDSASDRRCSTSSSLPKDSDKPESSNPLRSPEPNLRRSSRAKNATIPFDLEKTTPKSTPRRKGKQDDGAHMSKTMSLLDAPGGFRMPIFDPQALNELHNEEIYEVPKHGIRQVPCEFGPPVPTQGRSRAHCEREAEIPRGFLAMSPRDLDPETAFYDYVSSDPLPFALEGDEQPTSKRGRKLATKVPLNIPSPRRTPKATINLPKMVIHDIPKREPLTKPPRKAPTNITPKKTGPKKNATPTKAEPEPEPEEEPKDVAVEVPVEPEQEPQPEPEKPKTPKKRAPAAKAPRKSVPPPEPVPKPEVPAAPAAVVEELTPSSSGRPQRQRKIPAKFNEDVVLETAVLSNAVPELRKSTTRTPRRSISIASESAVKRESISEVAVKEEPKELSAVEPEPVQPVQEPVAEPPLKTEEPEPRSETDEKPEEIPEESAQEPEKSTVEEEASNTDVEDTVAPEPAEAPKAPEPETPETRPEVQPAAPVEAPVTPAAVAPQIPTSSNNANVRSSGRIRKKPQDRDFYPGHHYARRDGPRKSSQKMSETDEYDIDPSLLAEILSHTEKLEQTISSPKTEVPEAEQVSDPAPEANSRGIKRKLAESDDSTASATAEVKAKPKKGTKKAGDTVFKTPLPPKPRAPRKSTSIDSPLPVEVKVEPIVIPSTPSTPMNFPMPLSAPPMEVKSYSQQQEFFEVARWDVEEYSDYLEYIEERQKANSQSVGLGFLRETLPATEDFFYREVLRSGGDIERVDSSPIKRPVGDRLDVDVVSTEELPEKDVMTADPAERIAKDIADFVARPIKVPEVPDGEYVKNEDEDLTWNIEDAKKLASDHDNPRFSRLLLDVINVISSQFVSFMSSFGSSGGPAIYYSHSVDNGRRLGNLLHRCIGDEQHFPNQIHEWMIRNLPLEFLARYLDIVRFLAEANKQNDLIMRMMPIGTDVMVNSCHNWVLEFTMAQTADPHTDLVKHSLKTVQLPDVVFVIVHPNISRASATTKAHVSMFRDLLPGIADHVDVKLQFPNDLSHPYDIMCYCVDTVIQEVQDTVRRFPEQHVVVAAWGVSCRIVQKALQDVAGVSAALLFAYPNESINADPDDEANLTYCPTLFVGGDNTCSQYVDQLQLTRRYMLADTGLVVVANADRNLLVSAGRLGIERLSQRTVDRAIVEHVYDFLKLIVKNANTNLKAHRRDMVPLNMAELMEESNTTIEDHKIKKTLFQSPSTARSSASRNQAQLLANQAK